MSSPIRYRGRVLLLCGPTASGKSRLAVDLAQRLNGVIINADAMQVYRELPILTACPSAHDEQAAPHMLYQFQSASSPLSVAGWAKLLSKAVEQSWRQGRLPIVVGGGGMYMNALREGLSPIPDIPKEIHQSVQLRLIHHGPRAVYSDLAKRTSVGASLLNPSDSKRVTRALEVLLATGRPLHEWQQKYSRPVVDGALFFTLALVPSRLDTWDNIRNRLEQMIDQSVLEEVRQFLDLRLERDIPLRRACGVAEMAAFLRGVVPMETAIKGAVISTRQVAKRQVSWIHNHARPSLELTGVSSRLNQQKLEEFLRVLASGPQSFDASKDRDSQVRSMARLQFVTSLDPQRRQMFLQAAKKRRQQNLSGRSASARQSSASGSDQPSDRAPLKLVASPAKDAPKAVDGHKANGGQDERGRLSSEQQRQPTDLSASALRGGSSLLSSRSD